MDDRVTPPIAQATSKTNSPLQLLIVDVGHGNATIIRDGDHFALIDAGAETQTAHLDELNRLGCKRIDHVVLSHADADHIGGACSLLADYDRTLGTLWYNSDGVKDSVIWARLVRMAHLRRRNGGVDYVESLTTDGSSRPNFGRVEFEVVNPDSQLTGHGPTPPKQRTGGLARPRLTSNSISIVLRVLFDGVPVALLAGDLDALALKHVLAEERAMKAPVLVFPHHGGLPGGGDAGAFAEELTRAVEPTLVVFSMQGGGRYANPNPEIMAGVRQAAPKAHIACTQLSVHCFSKSLQAPEWHLSDSRATGREVGRCCIGTLSVEATPEGLCYLPALEVHQQFVAEVPVAPLCHRTLPVPRQNNRTDSAIPPRPSLPA